MQPNLPDCSSGCRDLASRRDRLARLILHYGLNPNITMVCFVSSECPGPAGFIIQQHWLLEIHAVVGAAAILNSLNTPPASQVVRCCRTAGQTNSKQKQWCSDKDVFSHKCNDASQVYWGAGCNRFPFTLGRLFELSFLSRAIQVLALATRHFRLSSSSRVL